MKKRSRSVELIAEEAAEWFVLQRTGELNEAQRREFAAWLEASPVHIREYLEAARVWQTMASSSSWTDIGEGAASDNVVPLPAHEHSAAHLYTKRRKWPAMAAVISGLMAMGLLLLGFNGLATKASYATGKGEQRSIRLADGSVIEINAMSEVSVRMGTASREITLESGEALFRVAHDKTRPFNVSTRRAVVQAVGTTFNVYTRGQVVDVTVVEGKVKVSDRAPGQNAARSRPPIFLEADQTLRVGSLAPLHRSGAKATAWTDWKLEFDGKQLQDVVTEFNRYGAGEMEVISPALQQLRISGSFRADDPETLISYLEKVQGVRVDRGQTIKLSKDERVERR